MNRQRIVLITVLLSVLSLLMVGVAVATANSTFISISLGVWAFMMIVGFVMKKTMK